MSDELWTLLLAWRAGDREAGSRLVDATLPRLTRFFRNKVVRVPDDDDLVQRTLLALGSVELRSGQGSFWALLFGIARNILREYIRERIRRQREVDDIEGLSIRDVGRRSVSSLAVRTRELRAVVEALRCIPMRDQIVLELRYFEGMTSREISTVLDVPLGSVQRHVDRGLAQLREAVAVELAAAGGRGELPEPEAIERWAQAVREYLGS